MLFCCVWELDTFSGCAQLVSFNLIWFGRASVRLSSRQDKHLEDYRESLQIMFVRLRRLIRNF